MVPNIHPLTRNCERFSWGRDFPSCYALEPTYTYIVAHVHGFPVGSSWASMGLPWVSHGSLMCLPWVSHRSLIGVGERPWVARGSPVGRPKFAHGPPTDALMGSRGASWGPRYSRHLSEITEVFRGVSELFPRLGVGGRNVVKSSSESHDLSRESCDLPLSY